MATIAAVEAGVAPNQMIGECRTVTWANLTEADTGDAVSFAEFADRSIQVHGTFGGGTLVVEVSNDGTNWFTANDPQGNALSFTSARFEAIQEASAFIRVRPTTGTGVSLTAVMFCRRDDKV